MITNRGCKRLRDLEKKYKSLSDFSKLFVINREYEELLPERSVVLIYNTEYKAHLVEIPEFELADTIRATIDGVEYELNRHDRPNGLVYYGEGPGIVRPLWLEYDFQISTSNGQTYFFTHRRGSRHTIKIEAVYKSVDSVSEDFRMAVQYVIDTQQ